MVDDTLLTLIFGAIFLACIIITVGFYGFLMIHSEMAQSEIGFPSERGCNLFNGLDLPIGSAGIPAWCYHNETGWHYNSSVIINVI